MSEISKSEIYKLTKEQNYIRGYQDCKADMLKIFEDIKAEIENLQSDTNVMMYSLAISDVLEIIDKHIAERIKK